MRILYLTYDDLSRPYAWSIHVREIVNRLAARGHAVRLVAPRGFAPGISVPCDAVAPGRLSHVLGSLLAFVRSGRAHRPDAVYVRGIHATPAPALAAELLGRPLVVEVNGLLEHEVEAPWRKAVARLAHRYVLGRAARVVTVSPLLRRALTSGYGFPEERIDVVPNGADVERFRPSDRDEARGRLGLPGDRPIVLCVASFMRHHERGLLVEAAAATGARLVLVGGEAERNDRVFGVGPVPHENVPDYVAAADVCAYVLRAPHASFGYSPLKLYEYMAGGRPVVAATDLPEIRDFVNGAGVGKAGGLEADSLAASIRSLLADAEARERMGRRGRELAESTFNWDRAAGQVEASILRAVSGV